MPRVFISHSTNDRKFVDERICALLKRNGIEIWYAHDNIPGGSDWETEIIKGVKACDWFLVVMSHSAVASDYVKAEVKLWFKYRKANPLPVRIDDCKSEEIAIRLENLQHFDFRGDSAEAEHRLLRELGVTIAAPVRPISTPTAITTAGPAPQPTPSGPEPKVLEQMAHIRAQHLSAEELRRRLLEDLGNIALRRCYLEVRTARQKSQDQWRRLRQGLFGPMWYILAPIMAVVAGMGALFGWALFIFCAIAPLEFLRGVDGSGLRSSDLPFGFLVGTSMVLGAFLTVYLVVGWMLNSENEKFGPLPAAALWMDPAQWERIYLGETGPP